MKRSNLLLLILSVVLLLAIFATDHILALQYVKINLKDPYKNFQSITVKPFKALKIVGGNGYAIRIKQGDDYNIRLMNSRKDFFKMEQRDDTLSVSFTVANQNYQQPELSTVGLIISMPKIIFLQLSGTNNEVGPFRQDSLNIVQNKATNTRMKQLHLDYLKLEGTGSSYLDFQFENNITSLSINMKNTAVANFHQVNFNKFNPLLYDSAAIILYKQSLTDLQHTGTNKEAMK